MVNLFSFFIPYLFGIIVILWWRKRQEESELFFFLSSWTLFSLFIYLAVIEGLKGSFYVLIPFLSFLLFWISYRAQKAKLLNGLLFNLFLAIFAVYLFYIFVTVQDIVTLILLGVLGVIGLFILVFGVVSLLIMLYWNGLVMLRKESHSLANLLTLILAIALTLWLVYDYFFAKMLPQSLSLLLSIIPMAFFYFSLVFLNFLTVSILYQFNQPKFQQDCVIVLGAGLIDGERVTPLLAKRIDRAIAFYQAQIARGNFAPKLLMSGGQGSDEKIAESIAMKQYALTQGIPAEDVLIESNSTNTLENMKFSKEIIQQKFGEKAKVIFCSNNYHIFRAGIFAHQANLKADGIGAKTALYYLPTAFLREFIAIVAMNRKRHFIWVGLGSAMLVLLSIISFITG